MKLSCRHSSALVVIAIEDRSQYLSWTWSFWSKRVEKHVLPRDGSKGAGKGFRAHSSALSGFLRLKLAWIRRLISSETLRSQSYKSCKIKNESRRRRAIQEVQDSYISRSITYQRPLGLASSLGSASISRTSFQAEVLVLGRL
jgi:hypothetical protein